MIATKHRVFCSYTLSDEREEIVSERMRSITGTFSEAGVDSYCNLFDIKTNGITCPKTCLDIALDELRSCDIVLVVMSERRSEGMLIEVGVAYAAGKPIVLARHQNAIGKTYIDRLADITMDWSSNQDLERIIETVVL